MGGGAFVGSLLEANPFSVNHVFTKELRPKQQKHNRKRDDNLKAVRNACPYDKQNI
jgi:hypothetical protein